MNVLRMSENGSRVLNCLNAKIGSKNPIFCTISSILLEPESLRGAKEPISKEIID